MYARFFFIIFASPLGGLFYILFSDSTTAVGKRKKICAVTLSHRHQTFDTPDHETVGLRDVSYTSSLFINASFECVDLRHRRRCRLRFLYRT